MSGGAAFEPQARPPLFAAVPEQDPAPDFGGFEIATRSVDVTPQDLTGVGDLPQSEATITETLAAVLAETPAPPPPAPAEEQVTPVAAPVGAAWRQVAGDNVNVRAGPGRDFEVVDQVTRGTLAEILSEDPSGWIEVRIEPLGNTGWILGDFLAPVDG